MRFTLAFFAAILLISGLNLTSCKHDTVIDTIIDNNNNNNNNPQDSTENVEPCDSTIVYFEQQILPLITASCAYSGCHDAASAEDGVILDSYENIMQTAKVKPFNPGNSELYEVLVENDLDDRMPPPPNNPLTTEQIDLIALWIAQGAENTSCDNGCDTTNVTFNATILPIISTYCQSCHSGTYPSGGIDLTSYTSIKKEADSGKLLGSIRWDQGYAAMPEGSNKMPDCKISQIETWINEGALNN